MSAGRRDGPPKNPAAVALGKLGGQIGGKARAAILTPERRREIGRAAAFQRWHGYKGDAPKILFVAVAEPHYEGGYQVWSEREMVEIVGAHYPYWDWPLVAMHSLHPDYSKTRGRPFRKYLVRDVVRALPPRTRCDVCGKPWSRWDDGWRFLHRTIRQCSVPCVQVIVRRAQRVQRQRRKEQQWLRDAQQLLKAVRAAARGVSKVSPSPKGASKARAISAT